MGTAQTVIDAYNAWDIDAILAYRTPDCQHQVLPSSMARAAQTNDEYRKYLSTIMPMFSNFTVAPPLPMAPCRVTKVGTGRGSQGDT
jgi:ketosteroid isomerase-like protein